MTKPKIQQSKDLERAIYNTIRYFDIHRMPVTDVQIWQYLVEESGQLDVPLHDIVFSVRNSEWLAERVQGYLGYWGLRRQGFESFVDARLQRHAWAQMKWKITRRLAYWLQYVPFVQGLAGSGSLALDNTNKNSDLDVLVIAKAGRIWTARLFLLLAAQLFGRRRKYWQGSAPDQLCLNHYIVDDALTINASIQSIYTAVLYRSLVPLSGMKYWTDFWESNTYWLHHYVSFRGDGFSSHVYMLGNVHSWEWLKRWVEAWLLEPVGDFFEIQAERMQRWVIAKHADSGGRIVLSHAELAFHPGSKARDIATLYKKS